MKAFSRIFAIALGAAALSFVPLGCDHDDGGGSGGWDFGGNDPNLVVCLGDSITQGYRCVGAPYPSRLAAYSGKTVLNYGVGGAGASHGVSRTGAALARKPGHVCILFGANDCIAKTPAASSTESLRRIVRACKANKSRPIVATPTPTSGFYMGCNPRLKALSAAIRTMAKEEGVPCVDLNGAFGDGEGLLVDDGLHMTDAGSDLIARKFNSKL